MPISYMKAHCFTFADGVIAKPCKRKDGQRACCCIQEQLAYESVLWFGDRLLCIQIYCKAPEPLCWHPGSEAMNDVLVSGKILLHALPQVLLFPQITKDGNEAVPEMPFILF